MQPDSDLDISSDLSAYLKKADFDDGERVFVIASVARVTFEARSGRPAQTKIVLTFEGDRRLSLNKTNLNIVAKVLGKRTAAWIGRSIVIAHDPTVTFGTEEVGGLRVRVPRLTSATAAAGAPPVPAFRDVQPAPDDDDLARQIKHLQAELAARTGTGTTPPTSPDLGDENLDPIPF